MASVRLITSSNLVLLDGKVRGLGALENLVDENGDTAVSLVEADSIRHETTGVHVIYAAGLMASTMLYALPKTNPFDVRQMIHSNSTNVRILSRYFHNSMC